MHKIGISLTLILVLAFLLSTGCAPTAVPSPQPDQPEATAPAVEPDSSPQAAATATPAPATPTATPAQPQPPVVLSFKPESGQEQPLEAPLEIAFDQPMDRNSVEKAFAIEPGAAVDGTFTWLDDQTLQFTLDDGFERDQRYRVRLVETAQSQAGLALAQPYEWRFSTVGALEVINVQPAAGTTDVWPDTIVTVFFNRPVVALNALEDKGSRPNPLTFVPPVTGRGEWLNSSTYQFTPDTGFQLTTRYTARVAQGLSDTLNQAVLTDDFEWQFTTISPTPTPTPVPPVVTSSTPEQGAENVSPTTSIDLTFSQPMDRQHVQENFALLNDNASAAIPGKFIWQGGAQQFTFTPDTPLDIGTVYRIQLPYGVRAATGQDTTQIDFTAVFTVAPPAAIVKTYPEAGSETMGPWERVQITFNTPIDPESVVVGENLLIEPAPPPDQVYTYWQSSGAELEISFPLEFSQAYTVTLGSGISGRYGQPLAAPQVLPWKTQAKSPLLIIQTPHIIATYNAYTQTLVLLTARNVGPVNLELYRLPVDDFIAVEASNEWDPWEEYLPSADNLIHAWQLETNLPLDENGLFRLDLGQISGLGPALPPDLYYLSATVDQGTATYPAAQWSAYSDNREYQILVVSKYNVTFKESGGEALAWVTDLQSGQPVMDVPTTFFIGQMAMDRVQTGQDGVASFDYGQWRKLDERRFAVAGNPDQPDDQFALGTSSWTAGIDRYDFRGVSVEDSQAGYIGYFYTHRALYRPGETVHFKGIIRSNDDAQYSLPGGPKPVQVMILDSQGKEIYSQELPLNEMGTVNGTLELASDTALGEYTIRATYANYEFTDTFEVLAYRLPEFQVSVLTDQARYAQGDTISVTVNAEFFFGGPVSNATVRWTLLSEDYSFRGGGLDAYDFVNNDFGRDYAANFQGGFEEKIAEGTGETDAEGRFTFEVSAEIGEELSSQLYTIDAVVTDVNNQEVASQARVLVHKGRFLVGLQPERFVGQIGQANKINVLVVDWTGQPVADQAVEVVFAKYNRYSYQRLDTEQYNGAYYGPYANFYWETIDETIPVFTTTVTTDQAGLAVANFSPAEGGIYQILANATDANDQVVRTSVFTRISGPGYINWGQEDHNRLELVADQTQYKVGDMANILIPHPFSGTTVALVTLERGHIYEHFVVQLETNSDQIQIPITDEMLPNMYVSVVVVQGGAAGDGLANFKLGYVALPINPAAKALQINMVSDKPATETYQPGEKVSYDIKVTDAQGQPVKAELSLALVDKAILSLAPEPPGQLLERFWHTRGLGVRTTSGLTLAVDRFNQAVIKAKGGGGGCLDCGGAEKGFGVTRRKLLDTALWIADFMTDENGEGKVEATLPDNLTTWTLTGIGVTEADTLVGESTTEIISTKPLLVRPVTPRFLIVGDEPQMGIIVQNNTDDTLEAETLFEAEGLEIGEWRLADGAWQKNNGDRVTLTVGPRERVKVEYQVTVEPVEAVGLTMGVRVMDGSGSDSLTFELPVYRYSTPETVGTAGVLETEGTRTEAIVLPQSFDPTQGGLTIKIDPSLAAGMRDGLEYLEHFPYECTEQTVSRFLPNVVTYRAYQQLGLDQQGLLQVISLEEKLPNLISLGLQRLYNQQHVDGGWGWWVKDESNPFLTAYVLLGLVEAQRAGFVIDRGVLNAATTFLETSLAEPRSIKTAWQANRQAFILYVLAEAGTGDLGRSVALFEQREQLDYYGRAYLAMTMHILDEKAPQIETLVNDLTSAAITSATGAHWEESQVDYWSMNTDTRSTAIIIAALTRIQPDHPLLPNAVRWLMTIRENGGHWETTQETAWAIIGLTDWLVATGELEGRYTWRVSLNDKALDEGTVTPENIDQTTQLRVEVSDLLAGEANRLAIERDTTQPSPSQGEGQGGGRLYYTAHLNYYKPVNEVKALDQGIIVSRQYRSRTPSLPSPSQGEGQGGGISEAKLGDVVEVKLTIIAPNDLHYVVVEDPIPAGTEGVNSSLAIASVADEATAPPPIDDRYAFSHTEVRDEKAVLFATYLPKGTYEYIYLIRASLPGEYRVLPTHAEEMYFPEVFGRSDGAVFRITE